MAKKDQIHTRLDRRSGPSLKNWERPARPDSEKMKADVAVDMGWGRLIFGQTFSSTRDLYQTLCQEAPGRRDISIYLPDPHVLLSHAPHELFLDPSHTYRLWSHDYRPASYEPHETRNFVVRRMTTPADARAINRIYAARQMVTCDPAFMAEQIGSRRITYLVAQTEPDNQTVGTVTGVDHVAAFDDPENGASLWCLAVDPQINAPGVGEALVRHLVEHYFTRGRNYVDLSVMHDNDEAIRLYEKLGFQRVPVFCVKRKNPINEPLYAAPMPEASLNPYAKLIIREARRRGIGVEIIDAEQAYFRLRSGGRSVLCRESLTDLCSAIAMSICDNKQMTHHLLRSAGLRVPGQTLAGTDAENRAFLRKYRRLVVKPVRGEQGVGISVDIGDETELDQAIAMARAHCPEVLLEEYAPGEDLRVIVIDFKVVAAAVRRPPVLTGTGKHDISELIDKYNRRREAATGGESHLPKDEETARSLKNAGYDYDTVLPKGEEIRARKAANLHTGGTIHDVTDQLHPALIEASERAARAINIPVTGLDLLVPRVDGPDYVIIEANERPGLANHEPQPTAERFMDLLFPQTASRI